MRVLICEDQNLTAAWLEKALARAGHEPVGRAVDGAEAVRMNRELEPDLILMDVMMPVLDGIAATQQIMAERPTPVVIITGRADPSTVDAALQAGASAYLVKPLAEPQLGPTFATATARFRERQALDAIQQRLTAEEQSRREAEAAADAARIESLTDPLTKAANRRGLMERLDLELARSARSGSPLTVVLLDVDHFKQVNDRWGHHTGDRLLRDIAEYLRHELRKVDLVARIGGDEFVILLPDTGSDVSQNFLVRIFKGLHLLGSRERYRVTFSVGVATSAGVATADSLIRAADEAMYTSKLTGGGRLTFVEVVGSRAEGCYQRAAI